MDDMLKVCDEIIQRSERRGYTLLIMMPSCYAHAPALAAAYRKQGYDLNIARDARDAALKLASEYAAAKGQAEGKLAASEMAGVVQGWRERAMKAESELATLREACKKAYSLIGVQPFNTIGREVSDELNAALVATEGK